MKIEVNSQIAYLSTLGRDVDPTIPSIVFVHGAALDHSVWTLFTRYFTRHGYNAIAVDLPGHGRSEGEPLGSIQAQADWLAAMASTLGLAKAIWVGHSMGSLAVFDLAVRHSDITEQIALVGTSLPMAVTEELLKTARQNEPLAFDMVTVWGHGPNAHIGGINSPGMWLVGSGLRLLERSRPGVLFADLNACNNYTEDLEQAARIRCPVLLVLGEKDAMTPPRTTRKLSAALGEQRTITLTGDRAQSDGRRS